MISTENKQIIATVIVPVYKVEEYIRQNIESILRCNKEDIEIIFVNDGSPDNSRSIIEDYINQDKRIVIIDQENAGLSAARNTGLRYAKGRYVFFVDSDDEIEGQWIDNIIDCLMKNDLDMMQLPFDYVDESGKFVKNWMQNNNDNRILIGYEFLNENLFEVTAWSYVYRREFLVQNQLFFAEGRVHEDVEFTPRAVFFARRIMRFSQVFYHYRQRRGSIMTRTDEKKTLDSLWTNRSIEQFYTNNVNGKQSERFFRKFAINGYSATICNAVRNKINITDLLDKLNIRDHVLVILRESNYYKHHIIAWCLKHDCVGTLRFILKVTDKQRGIGIYIGYYESMKGTEQWRLR